jgi:hypothetical protein
MKVNQNLLEKIILEVVGRLAAKPKLLLVYDGIQNTESIEPLISKLQDYWLVELFSTTDNIVQEHSEFLHLAFLNTNQDLLARGALGLTDTPTSKLLAQALQNGWPVLFEPSKDIQWLLQKQDHQPIPEQTNPYRTHLLQYKNKLVEFGAWFGLITSWRPSQIRYGCKLLTEKDIQKMDSSEILVSSSTIITHLARDTARQKGIQIRIDHEELS